MCVLSSLFFFGYVSPPILTVLTHAFPARRSSDLVSEYASYVRQACESEADAVVVGAGLPLDLPELTSGFPKTAIIPILSDVRGIGLILKKWMRKNRDRKSVV